jgi:hypothetical protein
MIIFERAINLRKPEIHLDYYDNSNNSWIKTLNLYYGENKDANTI